MLEIKPDRRKALFFAKRHLAEFVCDAVNLEGIRYTLPEVQTLLDGVTVGGHKLSDQLITLNQAHGWHFLFEALEQKQFALTKIFTCQLHAIAAREEALTWGQFRSSQVTIAGTDFLPPPAILLDQKWEFLVQQTATIGDIYPKAIFVFLEMARTQFFYDVNKRMGRFMMNGILLDAGYPAINVPAKRQLEFNTKMLQFYDSGDTHHMIAFMLSCLSPVIIRAMSEH